MSHYTWDTTLDGGELGNLPAIVVGTLFGRLDYIDCDIERVEIHFMGKWTNVTQGLPKMTVASIEARFREHFSEAHLARLRVNHL